MGLLSNRIERSSLKPGDHIYSWRTAYIYAHHGIYIGNDKVIHFTQSGLELGSSSILDAFVSSVPKRCGGSPCSNCNSGLCNATGEVVSSCLDSFLDGGCIYRFEYSVSAFHFFAKVRSGTCTRASSDPDEIVVKRATYLLINGFGAYNLFKKNCEDFAVYCKTGLLLAEKEIFGGSGQIISVVGGPLSALASISSMLITTNAYSMLVVTGIYNMSRYMADMNNRRGIVKIEAEDLMSGLATGKVQVAEKEFGKPVDMPLPLCLPLVASDLEKKAYEAFVDDDFDIAVDLYSQAIIMDPKNAGLFADRAQVNIKINSFMEAVADANKAIELDPSVAKAYLRKGIACIKIEEYQTARAALEAGLKLAPEDSRFSKFIKECSHRIAEENMAAPVKPKYRHDYYNSPTEVVLTIYAKGIPAENVFVEFGEQRLRVAINLPGEEPYFFQPHLFGKIVPAKCWYQVLSRKIVIGLFKAETIGWPSLEFGDKNALSPSASNNQQNPSCLSSKYKVDWDKLVAQVKPEDSRFSKFIKECSHRIAEENMAAPVKPKYRHDYYNSPTEVVLTIYAKGIPAENVIVEFGEQRLRVAIILPGEEPYFFQPHLFGKIVPAKCRYQVLSIKIVIGLFKAETIAWPSLKFGAKKVEGSPPGKST